MGFGVCCSRRHEDIVALPGYHKPSLIKNPRHSDVVLRDDKNQPTGTFQSPLKETLITIPTVTTPSVLPVLVAQHNHPIYVAPRTCRALISAI